MNLLIRSTEHLMDFSPMVTPASLEGETGLCCTQYLITHTLAQIKISLLTVSL